MYVCARYGMHVSYISTIKASLTSFIAAMSAPFSKSREQVSSKGCTVQCSIARKRERDRSGQGHTEEDGHDAGTGRQGPVGPVRVG